MRKAAAVSSVWRGQRPSASPSWAIRTLNDPENGLRQLMKEGRAGTMTHACKRHGTKTLLAALHVGVGIVIGRF
jgi:hypothetical protein